MSDWIVHTHKLVLKHLPKKSLTHSSKFLFVGGMNSHSMGYSGSSVPQSHPHCSIPVHPDVRFKHLPFYDKLAELLKPSSLGMSPQIFYRCLSVHRGRGAWLLTGGACVVALGGGRVWLLRGGVVAPGGGMRGCSEGGMCGCSHGGCMVAPRGCLVALGGGMCGCSGGHAWLLPGACVVVPGGVHGCSQGGHAQLLLGGACVVAPGGACMVFSMRYGQWAGGTHPTGMHSCWWYNLPRAPLTNSFTANITVMHWKSFTITGKPENWEKIFQSGRKEETVYWTSTCVFIWPVLPAGN